MAAGGKCGENPMAHGPVLTLDMYLRALAAERARLADENALCDATGGYPEEIDAAFAAHSEKWHPAMRNLADTPAATMDGVIAKLRILAASMIAGRETVYDEDILLLAIADLERLSRPQN